MYHKQFVIHCQRGARRELDPGTAIIEADMPSIYDCSVDSDLLTGTRLARAALGRGEIIVMPTDTVYGVAADAFNAEAVQRLLDAKGRGRQSPPPVLIPDAATLDALAATVPQEVRDLTHAFWPGGLTVVLPAQPSLSWDLGETRGTVALRMPNSPLALELLRETGPLAVSSANKTGKPAATTAEEAAAMLGDDVAVYLDGGKAGLTYAASGVSETSSTIVDGTALAAGTGKLRVLRHGVVPLSELRDVAGDDVFEDEEREGT
jgi:tRNA threonylcarbamoyl adenosine modification protein (Sua5/YciO/YrdC/YwlC family)